MGEVLRGKQKDPIENFVKFCCCCGMEFDVAGSANVEVECGECGKKYTVVA